MRRQIYLAALFALPFFGNAQEVNVEKNITGAQVGLFGLDLYNETKIANKTTLRVEASLFPAIWGGDLYAKTGFAFYPSITLQPKYYYNISKRAEEGKNTNNNSCIIKVITKKKIMKVKKKKKKKKRKGEKFILLPNRLDKSN